MVGFIRYLMFVMSVTAITVMNCVVVLNVSLRTPNTHPLTNKVRKVKHCIHRCILYSFSYQRYFYDKPQVLLNSFSRVLGMGKHRRTPQSGQRADDITNEYTVPLRRHSSLGLIVKADEYMLKIACSELMFNKLKERNGLMRSTMQKIRESHTNTLLLLDVIFLHEDMA